MLDVPGKECLFREFSQKDHRLGATFELHRMLGYLVHNAGQNLPLEMSVITRKTMKYTEEIVII